jgi:hypothetical protein
VEAVTAPPWGHKPAAVVDHYDYWNDPPPALSPRVEYWLRRLSDGTWTPNKYLRCEGYDSASEHLGIYIWEYWHIVYPAMRADTP